MRHTIRKQVFDLWVHRELDVLALQQRVSDRFWMDILPELEKCFDKFSDEESVIQIDRLEIDLGLITEEMIDTGEWSQLFRQKLEEALEETMSDIALRRGVNVTANTENVFGQWVYFIRHGHLPWNSPKPTEKWFQLVLESLALNYKSAATLRSLIAGNVTIPERIVMNHSPEFLSHLVELLTAQKQSQLPASVIDLASWLDSIRIKYSPVTSLTRKSIECQIWVKLLQKVSVEESNQDTATIIISIIMRWLQLTPESLYSLIKHLHVSEQFPIIGPIISNIVKDVEKSERDALKVKSHKTPGKKTTPPSRENIRAPSENASKAFAQEQKTDSVESQKRVLEKLSDGRKRDNTATKEIADKAKELATGEGIFIAHAGLVLLHPFIHTFFRKLNLVKDGKFIDDTKQERAVCLLHELTASGTPIQEYNLVLAKLLCAWPLHLPIDTTIELTDVEREEAQRVLTAAIEQWEILKNTTPLALQETFLQREGKLIYSGKWYLHIEKISVDILLAHLPWMISMIKLPWMNELLMVEWKP